MSGFLLTKMLVWYVVFLFSTTLHEAMHSYAARFAGDDTAERSGQATLNPIPHIQRSPVGMVVMPILSFLLHQGSWMIGWASAPFNPYWAARYPKRSFVMSLAGPFSHLPAVLASFIVMYIGLRTGFFSLELNPDMFPVGPVDDRGNLSYALALILNAVFQLNLVLFVFNLLPVPPLDGSEVWYLFVKREEDRLRYRMQAASYSLIGLMFAWWLFPKVFGYVLVFVLRLLFLL